MNDLLLNKKIFDSISRANNILLISHQRPDGDTLGSALALAELFLNLDKKYTLFCLNKPSPYFYFLPKIENIFYSLENLFFDQFDLIITLDCGDLRQTGIEDELLKAMDKISLINIDHHKTNENFGHLNLVVEEASSTSEIVYRLLNHFNFTIDKDIATCLLTGILTDTGNFTNAATNVASLKIASDLLMRGATFSQITLNISKNKPLATLKLWGRILSRLEKNELGVVSTIITLNDFEEGVLEREAIEGIANFLNNLSEANIILVLREEENGSIKGSLRSNNNAIDVSEIAKLLGGGGHRKAAGFTIKGRLVEGEGGWMVV